MAQTQVAKDPGLLHFGGLKPALGYLALFDDLAATPATRSSAGPKGFWVFTRMEAIREGCQRPDLFSSSAVVPLEPDPPYKWIPEMLDPPEHTKFRHVLAPRFSPGEIEKMAGKVRERCVEILDRVANQGECDFVADFARRYPTSIFMEIMGLPVSESYRFMGWEALILHGTPESDPDRTKAYGAMQEVMAYFTELIAARRKEPQGDLVSYLLASTIDGEAIPEADLLSTCLLLFMAGLDTVTAQLGYTWLHLARHDDDRHRIVADPGLIPDLVEESLRLYTIVNTARKATRDEEFHGCPVKSGDMVVFPFSAANHDPGEFPRSTEFELGRSPNHHIAFGAGPHRCLGAHLARRELRVALEEWHQRIPDYRIPDGAELVEHGGGVMGLETLPLVWR